MAAARRPPQAENVASEGRRAYPEALRLLLLLLAVVLLASQPTTATAEPMEQRTPAAAYVGQPTAPLPASEPAAQQPSDLGPLRPVRSTSATPGVSLVLILLAAVALGALRFVQSERPSRPRQPHRS